MTRASRSWPLHCRVPIAWLAATSALLVAAVGVATGNSSAAAPGCSRAGAGGPGSCQPTGGPALLQLRTAGEKAVVQVEGRAAAWSEVAGGVFGCRNGGHCVVPAGQTWVLDTSVHVETLTVRGTLSWDTAKDGLELRAGYVLVDDGGRLQVGTRAEPMDLGATIYITKGPHSHPQLGHRFLGGRGSATVDIHGRRLVRTWSLLARNAPAGSTRLHIKDDPLAMGWRAGDRVGLATTSPHTSGRQSTVHLVTAVAPGHIDVAEPLKAEHWGGFREIKGRRFEMAAEVVNLERSVLITGDSQDIEATGEGLHTIMTGTGYMDMRYARVENCGQRPLMGRYCLHFHLMHACPRCVFQGNAVVGSQHVGITIHGTHRTMVDQNVLWNARAVGLYTEDGNEMHNTFSRNVIVCTWWQYCSVDWVGGVASQGGGVFWIGMTNNLIENRVVGYEIAFWTPGAFRGNGHGRAVGRVCPTFTPFGEIRGNVMHDSARFGMYLDNQFPRNVQRDDDGYLTSRDSCNTFTPDGRDNGVVNEVRDQFDWHNTYVGQYALGDIQFINYTSVNNGHAMYWKQSKNFADGRLWHMIGCTFANDINDPNRFGTLQILGPSGPFTFGMKDSVFLGSTAGSAGALQAGQHCGQGGAGGPCNVQYLLDNVDFSGLEPGSMAIQLGVPQNGFDQAHVLPMFVARDGSLGGYRSIVSRHLNGFGVLPPGCEPAGEFWGSGHGCRSIAVRRLNIKGPASGNLKIQGPGYGVAPNWAPPTGGRNAGEMYYDEQHGGYGTPVVVGEAYTITGGFHADLAVEFSDPRLAEFMGNAGEAVTLTVGGRSCQLRASDDRRFHTPMGHIPAWGWHFQFLDSHSLIRGGRLQCGSPASAVPVPAPAPPAPAPSGSGGMSPSPSGPPSLVPFCADLPDVKRTCSTDGCKVLAAGMTNRPCTDYCESMGLMCRGAWEEVANDCNVKATIPCGEIWPDTSDLICECGQSTVPGASSWAFHPAKNCWNGNGARSLPGRDPLAGSLSLADCKAACEADAECGGVIVRSGGGAGSCWLREEILVSACVDYPDYDLWMRSAEMPAATLTTTTSSTTTTVTVAATTGPAPGPFPATTTGPPSTTSTATGESAWIQHPGINCLQGHGAEAIEGKDPIPSAFTLEQCQAECDADPACEGISMLADQFPNQCWLRAKLEISGCLAHPDYSVWERRGRHPNAGATTTTAATTTRVLPPSPAGPESWILHEAVNCWAGHGAVAIVGKDPMQAHISVAECKDACRADPVCEGAVVFSGQDPTPCWLRQNVRLPLCTHSYPDFAVWELSGRVAVTEPVGRAPAPAGTTPLPGSPVGGAAWVRYHNTNCWVGHGGAPLGGTPDPLSSSISLAKCKEACEGDDACEGIIMLPSQDPGLCWLRRDLEVSKCAAWPDYDLWHLSARKASSAPRPMMSPALSRAPRPALPSPSPSQAPSARPAPAPAPSPAAAPPAPVGVRSWIRQQDTNCWAGHGGAPLAGKPDPLSIHISLSDCKRACEGDAACEGLVHLPSQDPGMCWLRASLKLSECAAYPTYDVWVLTQ